MMSDGTDIDFLHGIVRYILGKTTDEGKAVMKAADEIERLTVKLTRRTAAVVASDKKVQTLTAELKQANAAIKELEPYTDAIICYASTISQHDGNRVAKIFKALAALEPSDRS